MADDIGAAAMNLLPSNAMSRMLAKHHTGARRKVLLAIGTRPEAVKMAPVVHELRRTRWADVKVLATAQHRELLDGILDFFGVRPDLDLDAMRHEQTLADLTARMLTDLDTVLARERPDLVFAQGDTTTVFVTALACYYRRVPFAHVEAGLRTGDKWSPFPEEGNRGLVGRLADLHFAPTERARTALLAESVSSNRIFVTGNTVVDALLWTKAKGADPEPATCTGDRRRILLTTHRRENFGEPLRRICAAVREIVTTHNATVVCPVHPNPEVGRTLRELLGDLPAVELCKPLAYPEFVGAMQAADLILTDSGGVQEEAPTLGKPILVLRDTTERPEGVEAGTARLIGTHTDAIVRATTELLLSDESYAAMANVRNPYGDGRAAERIVATAAAYLGVQDPV